MTKTKGNRRVWTWEDLPSWEGHFWSLMSDMLTPKVVLAFQADPPDYVVGDDLSWLDDIVLQAEGLYVDTKSKLCERIFENYDAIRAYHGTRIDTTQSFYEHGIQPLDPDKFEERAREIFVNPEFSEITHADLDKAIADVGRDLREGRAFFTVSRTELVDYCAHYMLYGSEYVTSIAASLGCSRPDYRQVLKRFGKPTVLVCDVPLRFIHDGTMAEFAGQALATLFKHILDKDFCYPDDGIGGGFGIKDRLPPNYIVDHFHPTTLRDPLLGRMVTCDE